MDAIFDYFGVGGTIGMVLGLMGVLLLAVIAARLARVTDLLDEIAELVASGGRLESDEVYKAKQNQIT